MVDAATNVSCKERAITNSSATHGGSRRLDIQGLRAIAVLMVVAFHVGLPVPGGFLGVDVFFVISGFVITAMLMREWDSTGRIRLGRFYVRRFKRLTPALAVTVGVVMAASALLFSPLGGAQVTAAQTAMGAMLLAANVVIARTTGDYFDARAETNPLLNMWSLSVEEQFYLVFPALLLFCWLLGRRSRRSDLAPLVVGAVGAVSFALALAGSTGLEVSLMPDSLVGFYGPATRVWEFSVGSLLAWGGSKWDAAFHRLASRLALAGTGMLLASLWLITGSTPFPGVWTLLPVVATSLLLAAGTGGTSITRALASGPMVAIGDRSYSIYLWHWPFIVFAQLLWPGSSLAPLVAAGLSLVPAYASYRWIEQPFRAVSVDGGLPLLRLVAAMVVPPLALAGSLRLAASNGYWNRSVQEYRTSIAAPHSGISAGCTDEAWRKPSECTWNSSAAGPPIYLVGDSNADQFSEALIAAATSASRPITGVTENGCTYLPAALALPSPSWDKRCGPYTANAEAFLVTAEPGLVVIANSYLWFRDSRGEAIGAPGQEPSRDPAVKLDALSTGRTSAIRQLDAAGHEVLLVQAIPHWGDQMDSLSWGTCSVLDMVTAGCARTMPMADVLDRQKASADVVAAVAQSTGAHLLDLSSELCPDGVCSSIAPDGMIRYRDGTHITVQQSVALTASFEKAIAAAG